MLDFNFILILFSESHQTNKKKENEKEEKRSYLFAILTPNRNLWYYLPNYLSVDNRKEPSEKMHNLFKQL